MPLGQTYKTGTLDIANGSSTVTGHGTVWLSVAQQGDILVSVATNQIIGWVNTVDTDLQITLFDPYLGTTLTGASYRLYQWSLQRYDPALTQKKLRDLLTGLAAQSIVYYVVGTLPDPSLGEDGQFAIKINAGAWQAWQRQAGVWVLQSTPVGTNWRGAYASGTTYAANDAVSFGGSSYISIAVSNVGHQPDVSPTFWNLVAQAGAAGRNGGVFSFSYNFSTITSNSDPGAGVLRFNSATIGLVDHIYISDTSSIAQNLASTIALWGSGTSAVKANILIQKSGDQVNFIEAQLASVVAHTGYHELVLSTPIAISTFTPANSDALVVNVQVVGDKGQTGSTGAIGINWRQAYSAASDYALNDGVNFNGAAYICIQANLHTAPQTPGLAPTFWSLLASTGVNFRSLWNSATAYAVNDVVSATNGNSYIAIAASTNKDPATQPTFWSLFVAAGLTQRGAWSSVTAYAVNDLVQRNNQTYVAIQAGTNQDPATATLFWSVFAAQGAAGPTGPAGTGLSWKGAYASGTTYALGDAVSFVNKDYISLSAGNVGHQPDINPSFWSLLIDGTSTVTQIVSAARATNYTAIAADRSTLQRFTASATLTLTAAATLGGGWFCYVKGDGGVVTVSPSGGDLIDGNSSLTVPNGSAAIIICDAGTGFRSFSAGSSDTGRLDTMLEPAAKTTNYTIVAGDRGQRITYNSAAPGTFTLPAIASAGASYVVWIRNLGVGLLTITPNGVGEPIDLWGNTLVLDQGEEALMTVPPGSTGWRSSVSRREGHQEPETSIATAATMDIGASNTYAIFGTGSAGPVTSLGTRTRCSRRIRWQQSVTVTHNATTLAIPGGASLTVQPGDIWDVESDASGNWRVVCINFVGGNRERLTSARTYFINPSTGSDGNTGLSSGTAFQTVQKAINTIANNLDIAGQNVTIQLAAGTYTTPIVLKSVVGFATVGNLLITGDTVTPTNVNISITNGACITATGVQTTWQVTGVALGTVTSGDCIILSGSNFSFGQVTFNAAAGGSRHVVVNNGSRLTPAGTASYTIAGGASTHLLILNQSNVNFGGVAFTITGSPTFANQFVSVSTLSLGAFVTATFTGTFIGSRYNVDTNAVLQVGGSTTFFPGTVAGTTASGGQYV